MTRKISSLLILTLLLVAVASLNASNSTDMKFDKVKSYGFSFQESESQYQPSGRGNTAISLGTHTADGNSPGYIVARSYEDHPNWYNAGRTVDWRNDPIVHFIYALQLLPGEVYTSSAQWASYNYFNPLVGAQGVMGSEVWLYTDPFGVHGLMPQLAIDTSGHAMPATYWRTPTNEDDFSNCEIFWDVAGAGAWGTFLGDTLPASLSEDPALTQGYPKIELQHYNGQIITHIVAVEFTNPSTCGYWRRVGDNPTSGGWTYQQITQALNWSGEMVVAASPSNGDVAVVFMTNNGGDCDNVAYVESTDGGASWPALTPIEIINIDPDPEAGNWLPWCNVDALYDTEGYLHIVYNTMEVVDCASQGIDPARLYHWTDRVAGDNAGGKLSLVAVADFHGLAPMCGRAGTNVVNLAKGMISQCDTTLVIIWQQFGDPDAGDSLDCPTEAVWTGGYNSDIYMSVSSTLDGSAWDAGRNLTNSHNPDCDSTAANNCDHDNYASPARYAMNMANYDTTKWTAVPEALQVRDVLAPGLGDAEGWYIDVEYVDDLYAGVVRWRTDAPVWTYNPIKWFRLPCVEPIIKPQIICSHPDFLSPTNWVKTSTPTVIEDVTILNIGNAILTVGTISANVTTGDPSWVTITGTPGTIGIGGEDYFDVNLNPGGIVTTAALLEAEITIASDDPDRPLITAFEINTVIADTVVQVVWDTVNNASNFALTVANQGQLGHSGWGNVNMDFVHTDSSGPECTITDTISGNSQHVYLYDACPVMMIDDSEVFGTYAWNPFWIPARASEHDFRPVPGAGPSTSTGSDYMEHVTDLFVSPDSSVKFLKHTYIIDGNNFVVEGYKITADATTNLYFGEWIDWDVPTLGDGNQGGTVVNPGGVDYVYQQGYNDLLNPECHDPEMRFGASGLLGYWYQSENDVDESVRHTGLFGGHVLLDDDLFLEGTDQFIHDSAYAWITRNTLDANNSADEDQQAFLSVGQHEIRTTDTLYVYFVHATVYQGDEDALAEVIDSADAWFDRTIVNPPSGCCGIYADLPTWPLGYTGNTNCSADGKRTLSDITKLIDNVYISKDPLCCFASGNTNGSWDDGDCKKTLSDITKLIDAVYISKNLTEPCIAGCEQ